MKNLVKAFVSFVFLLSTYNATGQSFPTFRTRVSPTDTFHLEHDSAFGVGDDGIYNIVEPTVKSSSQFKLFKVENIHDFNLTTPWIEGKKEGGTGEYIEYTFDLTQLSGKERAFSINSLFLINGYRKDLKVWEQYTRVKKLKMYINNIPFAYILLMDTYKFQSVNFQDFWISNGDKKVIRFEILEVYPGAKYKNVALSELEFSGKYSEKID
jgi:hypothetical protein